MNTIQLCFLSFFVFVNIITADLIGQDLPDAAYDSIPIEAYDRFDNDTFTLPGESKPRQIFKIGEYVSKIKVYLDEVGEVFVHHVLGIHEEGYPYVEMYSRQPSSGFIQGIERYGHYRMLTRQAFVAEDMYNGNSRIEFVNGLNTIVRTINPRKAFTINGGKEMLWEEDNGELTRVSFHVSDCRKYVDTILYDRSGFEKLNSGCTYSGFIQYDYYNGMIKLSLHAGIGGDEPTGLETFEAVMYDTVGKVVGRVSGAGAGNSIYFTKNLEYVYISGGGAISEDVSLPHFFKIVERKTGKVLLERSSDEVSYDGFVIAGTNLGVYQMKRNGGAYRAIEVYVIDHDKNLMYPVHLHPLCQVPFNVAFYTDYCECMKANMPRTRLFYTKDFMVMPFFKK